MKSSDWELIDVEGEADTHPDSFFIPSLDERQGLRVGAVVQLHFRLNTPGEEDPHAERMWLDVIEVLQGSYRGTLRNMPAAIRTLQPGDVVQFEARHVGATLIKRTDPRWTASAEKTAIVSKAALPPHGRIRVAHLGAPTSVSDSGWTFITGDEPIEELETPSSFLLLALASVAERCAGNDGLVQSTRRIRRDGVLDDDVNRAG